MTLQTCSKSNQKLILQLHIKFSFLSWLKFHSSRHEIVLEEEREREKCIYPEGVIFMHVERDLKVLYSFKSIVIVHGKNIFSVKCRSSWRRSLHTSVAYFTFNIICIFLIFSSLHLKKKHKLPLREQIVVERRDRKEKIMEKFSFGRTQRKL